MQQESVSSQSPIDPVQLDLSLQNLQRMDEAVDRADSKSEVIATANVGLLTILLGLAAISGSGNVTFSSLQAALIYVGFVVHFIASVASTYFAIDALSPRLTTQTESLFYFGTLVAHGSPESAIEQMEAATPARYVHDIREQLYHNACIAQAKYDRLRWSVRLLYVSGVSWMVLMVLLFVFLIANVIV